jgi:hypothetical protein
MLETVGEDEVSSILSDFFCPQNREIEYFIHNNAIDFAKKKMSITYLVIDDEAQFGKNYGVNNGHTIDGNRLMELAMDILKRVQHQIGGGVVFLECEDNPVLLAFYQNERNGFRIFGERYSDTDHVKYLKLLRFF